MCLISESSQSGETTWFWALCVQITVPPLGVALRKGEAFPNTQMTSLNCLATQSWPQLLL